DAPITATRVASCAQRNAERVRAKRARCIEPRAPMQRPSLRRPSRERTVRTPGLPSREPGEAREPDQTLRLSRYTFAGAGRRIATRKQPSDAMANPASAAIAPVIGTPMLSAPANSAGAIA